MATKDNIILTVVFVIVLPDNKFHFLFFASGKKNTKLIIYGQYDGKLAMEKEGLFNHCGSFTG